MTVQRYDHAVGWGGEGSMMDEADLGDYVRYDHYEELETALSRAKDRIVYLEAYNDMLIANLRLLKSKQIRYPHR